MLRITLLALSLVLSAPQVSADAKDDAGAFEFGIDAYQRGDFETAEKVFRFLAENGYASAQFNLGLIYNDGQGVLQNYAEAVRWFRLAAEQGDAAAQTNLGNSYRTGQGILKDYAEALKWYRLAAEQGNGVAQAYVGFMYEHGKGVAQDNIIAHVWYNLGSTNGAEPAREMRDEIAAQMTAADIAKAQAMARKCMKSDYKDCGD